MTFGYECAKRVDEKGGRAGMHADGFVTGSANGASAHSVCVAPMGMTMVKAMARPLNGDRLRKTIMAGDAAETTGNLKFNSHAVSSLKSSVSTLCTLAGRQDAGKKTGLGCLFIIVRM